MATAPGAAGVSVFRLSGDKAAAVFENLTGGVLPPARKAVLRTLRHPHTKEIIDRALAVYFPAPHSFTGEPVVEFHTHGGRAVMKAMLDALSNLDGCRLAEPGEFTRRAFLNGKMDLTAAEGIGDLIHAETEAQRRQALRLVEGELEKTYESYRAKLLRSLALVEAYIDFPDEDLPDSVYQELCDEVKALRNELSAHLQDNRRGERIRDGLYIVIVGAPNAGKSTLMNYLAKRDISIVSDTAGTTRDVVEVHLSLGGYAVTVADTAGLREASDSIESEGIRRALARAKTADIKLAVFDASLEPDSATLLQIDENTLVLLNKIDSTVSSHIPPAFASSKAIPLSLKSGEGVDNFFNLLENHISGLFFSETSPIITRARHRTAIEHAVVHLNRFLKESDIEFMGEELRLAMRAMSSITGRIDVDEILGEIFSSFCIGK